MFMIRIFFLLISIIFISQNLYALEKEMGKIKPEVVIACKEIKNGVESKEVLFKKGFNKTDLIGGTWLIHTHKWDSDVFAPADDFLTSLDEKTYIWADVSGDPIAGSQALFINILELEDKDLSSKKNKKFILQEFIIMLLTPLEVSQNIIKSKKILLDSKTQVDFENNIIDHHMKLQKAQKYAMTNKIRMSKPYISACYKE